MKLHRYFILIGIAAVLSSCEKVIDLDLKGADTRLVVEGGITNIPEKNFIRLRTSASFFEIAEFERITGAEVVISDNFGNREVLVENEPGNYLITQLSGVEGRNYNLEINYKNETYQANSTFPPKTEIDSLSYQYRQGDFFFPDGYYVTLHFNIPTGATKYYLIKMEADSITYLGSPDEFLILSTELLSTNKIDLPLNQATFGLGKVKVELAGLNKDAYDYYAQLNAIRGNTGANPFAAVPENPKNNLSGNALGYFMTQAISADSIIVSP